MREPSSDTIRDLSARLPRPEAGPAPLGRLDVPGGDPALSLTGQHFDIFAREAGPRSAGWVVCWSDLMMTMFIMFAALYAFQAPKIQFKSVTDLSAHAVHVGDEPSPPRPMGESVLGRIHDRIRDMIERSGLEGVVAVRLVPEKELHVTVSGDFLFGAGGSALRPEVKSRLLELASILRSAPHILSVVGHAAPDERLNDPAGPWRLSTARATEVAMFLSGEGGLSAQSMVVAGYGDQRPLHAGDGFGSSRRVELVLSTENPTEPLPAVEGSDSAGFRRWVAASGQGGQ